MKFWFYTEIQGRNVLTEFVHTAVIKEKKKRSNHHTALIASALIALLVQRGKERVQTNILVHSQTVVQLLLHWSPFSSPLLFHPPSGKGLFVLPASHTKVGINTRHCWKTKLIRSFTTKLLYFPLWSQTPSHSDDTLQTSQPPLIHSPWWLCIYALRGMIHLSFHFPVLFKHMPNLRQVRTAAFPSHLMTDESSKLSNYTPSCTTDLMAASS